MAKMKIKCIHCGSEKVVKVGKQKNGTPRCKCKKCQKTFQTEYVNKGALPEKNDNKNICKRKRNKRHCKGFRDKQRYSYETFKKTEKSLANVIVK